MTFYTDDGNWDLVGNNMRVFFIQDAMNFPDLVHAAKPEPHASMPQATTAHDFVSTTLGPIQPADGNVSEVDVSLEGTPAVLYDALALPDGDDAVATLRTGGRTLEFIKDQYRHCKPILAFGVGEQLVSACGIDRALPNGRQDPGVLIASDTTGGAGRLRRRHRHNSALRQRETDPPRA